MSCCKPQGQRNTFFYSVLLGSNEVPSVVTLGFGFLYVKLSQCGRTLTYRLIVRNLSSDITAANFYLGAPGVDSNIILYTLNAFTLINGELVSTGTWTSADTPQPLTPDIVNAMLSGNVYVNVLTEDHPTGEIRAQFSENCVKQGCDPCCDPCCKPKKCKKKKCITKCKKVKCKDDCGCVKCCKIKCTKCKGKCKCKTKIKCKKDDCGCKKCCKVEKCKVKCKKPKCPRVVCDPCHENVGYYSEPECLSCETDDCSSSSSSDSCLC